MGRRRGEAAVDSDREKDTIVIEDEVLRAGFTQIPNALLRRQDITPGAKLSYMMLLSYAWQEDSCFPGHDRLALDMGVSRRSVGVVSYLQQLQEAGLIVVNRRGSGQTNVYWLPRLKPPPRSAEFAHQEVQNASHPEVQNLQTKNTQNEEDSTEQYAVSSSNFRIARTGRSSSLAESKSQALGKGPVARTLEKRQTATGSARGRQKRYDTDRQRILVFIDDFARQFNDQAPLTSSVSRAYNLWRRSGIPIEAFSSFMYEARSLTNEYSAQVHKTDDKYSAWGLQKNKMAYYFAVLEKLVDQHAPNGGTAEKKRGTGTPILQVSTLESTTSQRAVNIPSLNPWDRPGTPNRPGAEQSGPLAKKRASKREEDALWETVRSSLLNLNPVHEQWLRNAHGYEEDGRFMLAVADLEAKAWIEARLTPAIQRALELSGRPELVVEVTR
jgi:hypothetical protein